MRDVPPLAPGGRTTVEILAPPCPPGSRLAVTLDVRDVVKESSERDNRSVRPC